MGCVSGNANATVGGTSWVKLDFLRCNHVPRQCTTINTQVDLRIELDVNCKIDMPDQHSSL